MAAQQITVDIVSDFVCPWCWLGKRYFDQAVSEFPGLDVALSFRPYMLDPSVPEEGLPYKQYMKAKFGDSLDNRFAAMRTVLEDSAPAAGIEFHFGDQKFRPNTLKAHMLMRWAQGQGKGIEASELLFSAYFKDLKNIGDINVLTTIAGDLGLDQDLVKDLFIQERDKDVISAEMDQIRGLGISGVPMFIYNGKYAVHGAQPKEKHMKVITKLREMI